MAAIAALQRGWGTSVQSLKMVTAKGNKYSRVVTIDFTRPGKYQQKTQIYYLSDMFSY
jgi:hypothetical protein